MKYLIAILMIFSVALYSNSNFRNTNFKNNNIKKSNMNLKDISFETMKPFDLYGGIGISSRYLIFEGISLFLTTKFLKTTASINAFAWENDDDYDDDYDDDTGFGFFADISGSFFPIINQDFRVGIYASTGYYIGNLFNEGVFHFYEFGITSEMLSKDNSTFYFKVGVMRFKSGSLIPSLSLGTNFIF